MSRWIILASPVDGYPAETYRVAIIEELEGSDVEAREILSSRINTYDGRISKVKRREVYKISEHSYILRIHGRMSSDAYLFQMAELIADASAPEMPDGV
ncbi:hypothetical protein AB0D59_47590 [Streptomyces sp. NPDC048417]|uniref:hypothetical protein n=1 Tax=Streptomyces sp. NPDC048417 TaxID=3155387 RepID=UPI003433E74E